MVKKYAILGKPVSHSLSPIIHTAAYEVLGVDWKYSAFEVSEPELVQFLKSHEDFSGFSLTMPLKRALFTHGKEAGWQLDDTSELLEASNTLVRIDGVTRLFNTDVFGARAALDGSDLKTVQSLAVLGSGATASSATLGALQSYRGISDFKVFSRSRENAAALLDLIKQASNSANHIQWLPLEAAEDFGGADLTINTLPDQVSKVLAVDVPLGGGWVFDVNYGKSPTAFSLAWEDRCRIDGKAMLLWQAVAQIRAFMHGNPETELPLETEVVKAMRAALR